MKAKDIQQLSKGELISQIASLKGKIRDLRFTITTRQHAKVRDLLHARKDLARMLTIFKQMENSETDKTNKLES